MARPAIDPSDLDDLDHPVKRWISLLIVVVTFLGAVVGYLQQEASGNESAAGTEARRKGIEAVGIDLAVQAEISSALDVDLEGREARVRTEGARSVLESLESEDKPGAADAATELERFESVSEALAPLAPLLSVDRFRERDDPKFPRRFVVDKLARSDRASLRHAAAVEVAGFWSKQSGRYFLILTVIGVAILLLGLALVAGDRPRTELVVTALGMTVVSLGLAAAAAARTPPATPEAAVEHVAQGLRAENEQRIYGTFDYGAAIEAYDDAIELRPDYAVAYARRGFAHFTQGANHFEQRVPANERKFLPFSDEQGLRRAIADLEQAVRLGGDRLGNELSGTSRFGVDIERLLGYCYFLAGSYEQAELHIRRSIDLDDRVPLAWAHLGAVRAALSEAEGADRETRRQARAEARKAFERAVSLIEIEPDNRLKAHLYTAARSPLEWLVHVKPGTEGLARALKEKVVIAEMRTLGGATYGPGVVRNLGKRAPGGTLTVSTPVFDAVAGTVTAPFEYRNLPIGTPVTGVWYFRPGPGAPWNEARDLAPTANTVNVLGGASPETPSLFGAETDPSGDGTFVGALGVCPAAGEYRIEAYVQGLLTPSVQSESPPGVAGGDCA